MARAKRINLALQGGGAHGAFTWGVLDRLLEGDEVEIAGISGTSAGALNGAAVKAGLARGSRALARENLAWLWEQVGAITDPRMTPWLEGIAPAAVSNAIEASLPFAFSDSISRMVSPYASGPFYTNPLQRIVERFHYDEVCGDPGPAFHICATNVRTGKIRVFTGDDIGPDAMMASACLPTLFKAVEIPDRDTGKMEAYWDGGYTGNPALYPLFAPTASGRSGGREYQPASTVRNCRSLRVRSRIASTRSASTRPFCGNSAPSISYSGCWRTA
jgi:NTE family protein